MKNGAILIALVLGAAAVGSGARPGWSAADTPADSAEGIVVISTADCRRLVRHTPRPDVTYRPGVDVRGRPVKSADLNPNSIKLPEEIAIDITVNIFDLLGRTAPRGLGRGSEARLGTVVYQRGRLTFNGEPLGDDAEAAIAAACKKQVR